jgi:hypothetical protein
MPLQVQGWCWTCFARAYDCHLNFFVILAALMPCLLVLKLHPANSLLAISFCFPLPVLHGLVLHFYRMLGVSKVSFLFI